MSPFFQKFILFLDPCKILNLCVGNHDLKNLATMATNLLATWHRRVQGLNPSLCTPLYSGMQDKSFLFEYTLDIELKENCTNFRPSLLYDRDVLLYYSIIKVSPYVLTFHFSSLFFLKGERK